VTLSSPAIADVDGDPANGKEVVIGGADGILYAYRSDGSLLWSVKTPNYSCPGLKGSNRLLSSPAIGAIYGDGIPYVVVGYGGVINRTCDGGIIAVRGTTGEIAWKFSVKRFAKRRKFWAFSNTVFSSPALAHVDNSGKMVIGFGSFDRNVYLLNANGTVRWYYNAADTVWSSPAFANVDSDPDLEMIIGTDISANPHLRPVTLNGGYVYAFKTKTRNGKRIGFRDQSAYIWQTYLPQVIFSSPVVADVLPSSPGAEILIASGCYFPERTRDKDGKWIKILRASDGVVLQTLNMPACSPSTPAVADIDGDGVLEVLATANGSTAIGGDGRSRLLAFEADIPDPIWSVVPRVRGRNDEYGGQFISPVVADLDGNGSLEVVAANAEGLSIFAARDGTPLTCQGASCEPGEVVLATDDSVRATPAIADINGDGILDMAIGGGSGYTGRGGLYVWTNFHEVLSSEPGEFEPYANPWPMFRGGPSHTASVE
jgi:outer membrane protein assembly factor BamB